MNIAHKSLIRLDQTFMFLMANLVRDIYVRIYNSTIQLYFKFLGRLNYGCDQC